MAQLYELLYTSEIALEENPSCVADIIRVSRANNRQNEITGVLIFDGLHFCQYLEGLRDSVLQLTDRISRDTRHILFEIHGQGPLKGERRFSEWSMAYVLAQDEDAIPSLTSPDIKSPVSRLELLLPSLSNLLT